MLVHNYLTTWLYISDDSEFHSLCCKNPKSHVIKLSFSGHHFEIYKIPQRQSVWFRECRDSGQFKIGHINHFDILYVEQMGTSGVMPNTSFQVLFRKITQQILTKFAVQFCISFNMVLALGSYTTYTVSTSL